MDKGIEALINKPIHQERRFQFIGKKQIEYWDDIDAGAYKYLPDSERRIVYSEVEVKALIAALEQVQSERDKFNFAHKEWNDKTEWVQKESTSGRFGFQVLGMHRADVMTRYIAELESSCEDRTSTAKLYRLAADAGEQGIKELSSGIKFPGVMRCPMCDFSRTHINVTPTGMFAAESAPENCPNGCGPMWHDTFKRQYNELYDHKEQLSNELAEMKRKLAEMEAACDRNYIDGMKTGWNYCEAGNDEGFNKCIEHRRALISAGGTVEGSE